MNAPNTLEQDRLRYLEYLDNGAISADTFISVMSPIITATMIATFNRDGEKARQACHEMFDMLFDAWTDNTADQPAPGRQRPEGSTHE